MDEPTPRTSLWRKAGALLLTIAILLVILVVVSLLTSDTGISNFIYDF